MYEFESVLPGSGKTIKYKPITTGQIKKLLLYEATDERDTIEEALDGLITECVVTPDFNVGDMYLQDRFFLLVDLRRATKGSKYQFQTNCQKCKSQNMHNVDLGSLSIKHLVKPEPRTVVENSLPVNTLKKKKPVKPGSLQLVEEKQVVESVITKPEETLQEWGVVVLNENISVRLNLLTRNIQVNSMSIMEASTKDKEYTDIQKAVMVATITNALCVESIITPEGEEKDVELVDKIYFLDNLTQTEMEKISKWFNDNDFGLDFVITAKCEHCGDEVKRDIPVENFFY